jgi:hypothetical protein
MQEYEYSSNNQNIYNDNITENLNLINLETTKTEENSEIKNILIDLNNSK